MRYMTQKERTICRKAAGMPPYASRPVVVVEGDGPPECRGESFEWRTRGGKPIRYPSAYAKVGFSNMVYIASTYRVEVGVGWCRENFNDEIYLGKQPSKT